MRRKRGLATIIAIVLLVVTPTVVSLIWYKVTGNPWIRPLGITQEKIRAYEGFSSVLEIVAVVDWDPARSGQVAREDLRRALTQAFKVKGVPVRVVFNPGSSGTRITYRVGPSNIGPYPRARAAEGIGAAVEAYRMLARDSPES